MGSLLVILSAFGFSTLGVFGKLAYLAGFTRNEMLFWRFAFALPVFGLILLWAKALPRARIPFLKAVVLGTIGIGVEATLYFLTLENLGAAMTGVFLYLYPAFVALISHFFLRKRLNALQWLCVALALVGCALTTQSLELHASGIGILYGLAMGLWYALYLLAGDGVTQDQNPLTVSGGITVGSFIAFLVMLAADVLYQKRFPKVPETSEQWLPLLGLALIATVLPFATLYSGMKRLGATKTALLSTLEMVFTLVLAVFFLDEKLTVIQSVGAFLILLSVLLIKPLKGK